MKNNVILFTAVCIFVSCPIVFDATAFEKKLTPSEGNLITINSPEKIEPPTEVYKITDKQNEEIPEKPIENIEEETPTNTEGLLEQIRNDFILSTEKQAEKLCTIALVLEEHMNEQHRKELSTETLAKEQHEIRLAIEKQAEELASIIRNLEKCVNEQRKKEFTTEELTTEQRKITLVIEEQAQKLTVIARTLENHINKQDKRALTAEGFAKEQEEIYIGIENEVAGIFLTLDKLYEIQSQHENTASKHRLLQDEMLDAIAAIARTLDKQDKVAQATEYELYKKQLELNKKQSYADDAYSEILNRTNIALNLTILSVALATKTFFVHVLDSQLSIGSLLTTMLSVGILFTLYNLKEEEASSYRCKLNRTYDDLFITSLNTQ